MTLSHVLLSALGCFSPMCRIARETIAYSVDTTHTYVTSRFSPIWLCQSAAIEMHKIGVQRRETRNHKWMTVTDQADIRINCSKITTASGPKPDGETRICLNLFVL